MRVEISIPREHIFARDLGETFQRRTEGFVFGIDHGIGTVRGDDATFPTTAANLVMMIERVDRRLGGREQFDVEAFEQRARTERVLRQLVTDHVEVMISSLSLEAHRET